MKGGHALILALVTITLALTPTGIAPPANGNTNPNAAGNGNGADSPGPNSGLEQACSVANSPQPCAHLRVVTDWEVTTGESDSYNGTWTVDQTIHVRGGGVLTLDEATFRFTSESGGIAVDTGGVLRILRSTLEPRANETTPYTLDLAAGSSFTLNDSTLRAGQGVKLRTSDANVSGNLLTEIPLALHLLDVVEVNIHHNHFLDNEVSVNQTGGVTTLDANFFEGGETCVRDWLADPTIINNVFRGCHTGIWHERSNSRFELNDMEDEQLPPGAGIVVMDTNSPIIEGNSIRNYGTGILVVNATAYIRNNTIANNVGDGVRVVGNTQPMDIQGNLIADNGGDGIELVDAQDVTLANNTLSSNGGSGVNVAGGDGVTSTNDTATSNGGHGFVFAGDHTYTASGANASGNALDGFHVATVGDGSVTLIGAIAIGNAGHGLYAVDGTTADGGWWEGNGGAGVVNADANPDVIVSSECSYWGSPTGPTHEFNEGGTGDEAQGNVDYSPFRPSPSSTSCVITEIYYVYDG